MRVFLFWLAAMALALPAANVNAAEIFVPPRTAVVHHRHWYVARVELQSCFLMPDVVVALDVLGPYCSSPRGLYRIIKRKHW